MSHDGGTRLRTSGHAAAELIVALRERRVELELTQDELACKLGWSVARLQRYEQGHTGILPVIIERWAAELGMRVTAVPVNAGAAA